MNLMVTGHRPQRLYGKDEEVRIWLAKYIRELKPDRCISGMAAGVDRIFAREVIKQDIPLLCYYPFLKENFSQEERNILDKAASVTFTQSEYSKDCFYKRDCEMVDDSDVVLVVWDGIEAGGTYLTMKYAKEQNKEMYVYMLK